MGKSHSNIDLTIDNEIVQITNPTKRLWHSISKADYLDYLIFISPYMLPFLKNRLLTVIRFPNGVENESFYQKNCPQYAPSFIDTYKYDDRNYILCNQLPTLIWLGNQGAIEFHVPFNYIGKENFPHEVVFDLDPPNKMEFKLAIEAALLIKEILNKMNIDSFVKLSGNKGIQIHIPFADEKLTYSECRIFTHFVAQYLIQREPKWFTIERLKEKRNGKLYVDYVQHWKGKTIIAPYSVRGTDKATVAAPLKWEEVNENLSPDKFSVKTLKDRIVEIGDPLQRYFEVQENQSLTGIINWIDTNT